VDDVTERGVDPIDLILSQGKEPLKLYPSLLWQAHPFAGERDHRC
jgi:hypothetical protein